MKKRTISITAQTNEDAKRIEKLISLSKGCGYKTEDDITEVFSQIESEEVKGAIRATAALYPNIREQAGYAGIIRFMNMNRKFQPYLDAAKPSPNTTPVQPKKVAIPPVAKRPEPKPATERKKQKPKKTSITSSTRKQKELRPNPFAGAGDIYVTKSKIVVTNTKNTRTKRGFRQTTSTKYYEQNGSNTRLLRKAGHRTVRVGRKGNNYRLV